MKNLRLRLDNQEWECAYCGTKIEPGAEVAVGYDNNAIVHFSCIPTDFPPKAEAESPDFEADGRHLFVGRLDRWCEVCNRPDRDPIHVWPRLGSDETGAKPVAKESPTPVAALSAFTTDSSHSSPEARHGVAAELIKKIERGIRNDQGLGDARSEAYSAAHALLALVDNLADRLYAATARDRFRDHLTEGIERFGDVPTPVKVLKIGEEFGEATEAFIGMLGANPRKGITHGPDDVADELADVAITALVAMGSFVPDPTGRLALRLQHVVERGRPSVEARL